ncbi:MAG TPA: hypothetical protein VGQ64_08125 [Candidatus Limnocylindrales bacterium]|jgi:hypothetical protein|nr:hypothetical protein [Candidatus Limnocylindrales bacterium]
MKTNPQRPSEPNSTLREAVVWIDHDRAVIVEQGRYGQASVETLNRLPAESDGTFEARTIEEIGDHDRVVVAGAADVRMAFERAFVALTHRPDRLVDVESTIPRPRSAHSAG